MLGCIERRSHDMTTEFSANNLLYNGSELSGFLAFIVRCQYKPWVSLWLIELQILTMLGSSSHPIHFDIRSDGLLGSDLHHGSDSLLPHQVRKLGYSIPPSTSETENLSKMILISFWLNTTRTDSRHKHTETRFCVASRIFQSNWKDY